MSLKRGEKRSSFTRPDFGRLCEKKGGGGGRGGTIRHSCERCRSPLPPLTYMSFSLSRT